MSDETAEAGSVSGQIRIVMDDREPCELMLPLLEKCARFRVEVQRLPTGDYFVNDALLVERKTLPDLMQSIIEGRLFQQALRLVAAKHPAALILEGGTRDLQHTGMRWEAIQGALITIALFMGLPVLRSRSPEETVQTLVYAARQQTALDTSTLARHSRRPKRKAALQSYILQGLPGVGPKRAQQLLARFGSVEAVVAASVESLAEVEGLGPDTIRKIRSALA
jgi:DNA excision repair protein ERCC-4